MKELGEKALLEKQKQFLRIFRQTYHKKIIFLTSSDLNEKEKNGLRPETFFSLESLNNENYHFPNEGNLNPQGHQALTKEASDYLVKTFLNECKEIK